MNETPENGKLLFLVFGREIPNSTLYAFMGGQVDIPQIDDQNEQRRLYVRGSGCAWTLALLSPNIRCTDPALRLSSLSIQTSSQRRSAEQHLHLPSI